jgi:ATP-dependent Lhr-like helicase
VQTAPTLKSHLPRTWSPFFVRHGAFTPAQLAAIPPLLDGANVILCAATASGKDRSRAGAADRAPPAARPHRITFKRSCTCCPPRALIADIANRLAAPLNGCA